MDHFSLTPGEEKIYSQYATLPLPRHTSFPSVAVWQPNFAGAAEAELHRIGRTAQPVGLYVHVPFCEKLCYYCACSKQIVSAKQRQRHDPSEKFLEGLFAECLTISRHLGRVPIEAIHLGGGSPTFLSPNSLIRLVESLRQFFCLASLKEFSVEIDPRVTTTEHLETLIGLGCNRVSIGVQDFAIDVQRSINRVQPFEMVKRMVERCREFDLESINFDLIYGLPGQTAASFADSIEKVISLNPDRIALFRLAVLPEIFRWQNSFTSEDLPTGLDSLKLFSSSVSRLVDAGYEFIGLDHFAKPNDSLYRAFKERTLCRNFQGMSAGKGLPIIGIGPSAISHTADTYWQNAHSLDEWHTQARSGLPACKGWLMSEEDLVRQKILQELYCYGSVDLGEPAKRIDLSREWNDLLRLAQCGIVTISGQSISLSKVLGRTLVRVVAAVFDNYLPAGSVFSGLSSGKASLVG